MARPRIKKLRADSKFARLTEEERDELARLMLAGGISLEEHQRWLAARGVEVSTQSISEFYHRHVLPSKWQRMNDTAAALAAVDGDSVPEAARRAVAQRVLEMSLDPSADPKLLATFFKLMLDGEATLQNERRLNIAEAKAAAADAACQVAEDRGLSAEEKTAKIKEIFGLN